jgi:hypothetical protein
VSYPSSWYIYFSHIIFFFSFILFSSLFMLSCPSCSLIPNACFDRTRLTVWLMLWSAIDKRTILELYQWSIFIVIIEWLNGNDNRNSLLHFNKLRRARDKHECKLKEKTSWEP